MKSVVATINAPIAALPPSDLTWELTTDVLIIGAGAAGLSTAAVARARGLEVIILIKRDASGSASECAQGGLAAAVAPDDSPALHLADTLTAGAGLCDQNVAADLVHAAPAAVETMVASGARFDRVLSSVGTSASPLDLGREGGHSRRRIVHTSDASGAELVRQLMAQLPSGVRFEHDTMLLDILIGRDGAAAGVVAGRVDNAGWVRTGRILATAVVLATGGIGQTWATTSNPAIATGDGLAAAIRAGAAVRDLEFVQFHPTVLFQGQGAHGQQPLVTEALRGEGAVLIDANGHRFMMGRHPLADLAPRDVVAKEMTRHMRDAPGGVDDHLYLDARGLSRHQLREHFTQLTATCTAAGLDPSEEPIPVAPGAHYMCGGISADLWGRTSIPRLFAVGEVAATGLHGANRLASNSLTEALVAGQRCGATIHETAGLDSNTNEPPIGAGISAAARGKITSAMSRSCGVLRTANSLEQLYEELVETTTLHPMPQGSEPQMHVNAVEATSHTVATLVAIAAQARQESRGCHQRDDFPDRSSDWLQRLEFTAEAGTVTLRNSHVVTP